MTVDHGIERTSAAIVQHVPPEEREWYMEWQRGIAATAETYAGYRGADVYPPADAKGTEWVATIHFEDDASLQSWLNSSERAAWVAKLRAKIGDFELKTLAGGFSQWFSKVGGPRNQPTPGWKMAATVLLGLYPTVMMLTIFVGPSPNRLGLAFAMLVGNAMSVALLQWVVMPPLTRIMAPWLTANAPNQRLFSYGGLVATLLLLVGVAFLFHLLAT